jgi:hypothetical protein
MVDAAVDRLDLTAPESGFYWYRMSKLEHQFVNLRHIQHHTGQLADRLRQEADRGVEWVGGMSKTPSMATQPTSGIASPRDRRVKERLRLGVVKEKLKVAWSGGALPKKPRVPIGRARVALDVGPENADLGEPGIFTTHYEDSGGAGTLAAVSRRNFAYSREAWRCQAQELRTVA